MNKYLNILDIYKSLAYEGALWDKSLKEIPLGTDDEMFEELLKKVFKDKLTWRKN